jgi:polypyrimidine tract-binding protein 2
MSSSGGGGQQFRYTQTPSKVLHLRNLPWECTEEELVELCKPFGRIVNTKSGVGANRNQAFVEFVRTSCHSPHPNPACAPSISAIRWGILN